MLWCILGSVISGGLRILSCVKVVLLGRLDWCWVKVLGRYEVLILVRCERIHSYGWWILVLCVLLWCLVLSGCVLLVDAENI